MVAQLTPQDWKFRPRKAFQRLAAHAFLQGRPLTTGARWLNPLLFAQFRLAKRLPMPRRVDRPVFILGTGRSGTTILGKLLGLHRDLVFLNEPKALWQAALPIDDVIGSYTDSDAKYAMSADDITPRQARSLRRLHAYALLISAGRRVCDKYPELVFRHDLVEHVYPDAKCLFLIRNGLDTLTSITKWSQQSGVEVDGARDDWWGRDDRKWKLLVRDVVAFDDALGPQAEAIEQIERHEDRAAVEWIVTMRRGLALAEAGKVHTVRYESLCDASAEALSAIADYCGLREDPSWLAYVSGVLKPVPPREEIGLSNLVSESFHEMMHRLGYG